MDSGSHRDLCHRQPAVQHLCHEYFTCQTILYINVLFNMSIKSDFEALSKGALLEVLLPATGKFDAVAVLQAGNPEEIKKAPARKHLFLGPSFSIRSIYHVAYTE
jgi:hypothetical protein